MVGPFDPEIRRNPYPFYAQARRHHPFIYHENTGYRSIFRYEDIISVLKDWSGWASDGVRVPEISSHPDLPPNMLSQDPPEHQRLRGFIRDQFMPRVVRTLGGRVESIVQRLLDDAIPKGRVDFADTVAHPLPVIVIGSILGVPDEDWTRLRTWADILSDRLGARLARDNPNNDAYEKELRVLQEMNQYFTALLDERRGQPRNDLLSELANPNAAGDQLNEKELLQMLMLIVMASTETTGGLIGNAVIELSRHPDQQGFLRQHPEAIPQAIEEVLRYTSPAQLTLRLARRDHVLADTLVKEGKTVLLWLGSANRDENVFPNAEQFDCTRTDNRHIAFGIGPHYCLGARLVRLEALIALRTLLRRTRGFCVLQHERLEYHSSPFFRLVTHLPVELDA